MAADLPLGVASRRLTFPVPEAYVPGWRSLGALLAPDLPGVEQVLADAVEGHECRG